MPILMSLARYLYSTILKISVFLLCFAASFVAWVDFSNYKGRPYDHTLFRSL